MLIYEKPNFIQVVYYPEKNYIVFDWTDFLVTLEDIQELHTKALATAQANNCYYYIADTSKVHTVLRQEVLRWWGDVWVPRLTEAGLKPVTVVPTSALGLLSTRSWQADVVGGITMINVKTFAEAETAVRKLQEGAKEKSRP
jgi:hypothetical protein